MSTALKAKPKAHHPEEARGRVFKGRGHNYLISMEFAATCEL